MDQETNPDLSVSPRGISADEIRSTLTKMLSSRTFKSARGQSKFLAYAVTQSIGGHSEMIKEYWIGRDALGRGESFDPRHDPIVRTQARKLRLRLAKYYQTEGASDQIYIEFRKGSYVPVFQRAPDHSQKAAVEASNRMLVQPPQELRKGRAFLRKPLAILRAVRRWLSRR
jgi:hypothetical protein